MTMTDPIADMLTRIRNGLLVRHPDVDVPSSRVKASIAEILKREGYIADYSVTQRAPQSSLRLQLRYNANQEPAIAGLKRVSKPGLRIHVQKKEAPRAFGGIGISIVSTSQGIMTGREAFRRGIGGELMAYVW